MSKPLLFGLDWGTSTLRVFQIGRDGAVLARREGPFGILTLPEGGFPAALARLAGDWLAREPDLPILASGMVTSRHGWVEVPYVDCPAGLDQLAAALVGHHLADGRPVHFVPGLACRNPEDAPEVMRGEETQLMGALLETGGCGLFLVPGTHSKWAVCKAGQVLRFFTFLTGELYALLQQHSILGRTMVGDSFHEAAFCDGVRAALKTAKSGLLHQLFGVRTRVLFSQLEPEAAASFLSGLLIGTELSEARAMEPPPGTVTVIASPALATRYSLALAVAGIKAHLITGDIVARGHFQLALRAGLLS